jgi:hypothetical protein
MANLELECHLGAEREPDEMNVIEALVLHEGAEIFQDVIQPKRVCPMIRLTVAPEVRYDATIGTREPLRETRPVVVSGAGRAVYEQDRRALAGHAVVDPDPLSFYRRILLEGSSERSSSTRRRQYPIFA